MVFMRSPLDEIGLFGPIERSEPVEKKTGKKSAPPANMVCACDAQLVRVALEKGSDNLFDYGVPEDLQGRLEPGQRVRVPFGRGNKAQAGFCVEFPPTAEVDQVKIVLDVIDPKPLINAEMLELGRWISSYYGAALGTTLSAMLPAAVKQRVGLTTKTVVRLKSPINPDEPGPTVSSKGKAILEHLHSLPENSQFEINELAAKMGCTKAPFKTLARGGWIELVRTRELPMPDVDWDGSGQQPPNFELNTYQSNVLKQIEPLLSREEFNVLVLHGVTGSGKTEIYLRAIETVLRQGRQALLLVPEIALTPQTVERFRSRFKNVAVLHSALNNRLRHQYWTAIAQGTAQVVVGARSAIFAPLPNCGLILVDEEHEPSYKQDTVPRYHGRDVAIKRAQSSNIPIILGSATPSLETYHNGQKKSHYHWLSLPKRVLELPMPVAKIVDMRAESLQRHGNHIISRALEEQIRHTLDKKRQIILMLNRRGHTSFIFCPSCSFALSCPNCDVTLTCHQKPEADDPSRPPRSWVMCHYCFHATRVPTDCPLCRKKLNRVGPGTQMAEEELRQKFPAARLTRMDSDAVKAADYQEVLADFTTGETDILLGTQMIGKGLDFPNVDLVGVLNADTALSLPDFRSSERTFQLITQVAGRCGRALDQGRVLVQTFLPDEPVIQLACKHDYAAFAKQEYFIRKRCELPPFSRLARLLLRDHKLQRLEDVARQLREEIDQLIERHQNQPLASVKLRGPLPATIARIENHHRYQILIQGPDPTAISQLIHHIRYRLLPKINVHCAIDIDPINLM
jgi:primosomal protein N' (replication factor Y)